MKIEITTATVVAVVALASVHDSAAFSRNAHKTTHCRVAFGRTNNHPCTTALDASFDDETEDEPQKKKGFFANFFEELDAFVDDATSRRLGAGAQYYGKRKSSFYGKDDPNKKKDKNAFNNEEDYRGPSAAGYFKWVQNPETGEMMPVTRMKEVNVEKKTRF